MKQALTIFIAVLFAGCLSKSQDNTVKIPAGIQQKPEANEAVAYFSQGCFWHTEIVFQSLEGVRDAISGYAGGTDTKPDYEKVTTGTTGHAETVQVFYDPNKISFATLVKAFFSSHDPTQLNRQGNDVGTQYRSIAFFTNQHEKQIIEEEMKSIADSKKYSNKVVTEIMQLSQFYPAEDYHQEYIIHHPNQPYVANVSIPDYLHFKKEFKAGRFKTL
ncbi:MAG: peptide-methionine (S)-S-oxide reductase MsrA [Chitinophagaceae bacterium]